MTFSNNSLQQEKQNGIKKNKQNKIKPKPKVWSFLQMENEQEHPEFSRRDRTCECTCFPTNSRFFTTFSPWNSNDIPFLNSYLLVGIENTASTPDEPIFLQQFFLWSQVWLPGCTNYWYFVPWPLVFTPSARGGHSRTGSGHSQSAAPLPAFAGIQLKRTVKPRQEERSAYCWRPSRGRRLHSWYKRLRKLPQAWPTELELVHLCSPLHYLEFTVPFWDTLTTSCFLFYLAWSLYKALSSTHCLNDNTNAVFPVSNFGLTPSQQELDKSLSVFKVYHEVHTVQRTEEII